MAPVAIQLACATPSDDIRYVGMFMSLGVFFAGISVGASTFGDEKGGLYYHLLCFKVGDDTHLPCW